MDFIKIRFGDSFVHERSRLDKTIEEMLQTINPMCRFAERSWKPQMDMYETRREIIIRAEVAGVEKEDLQVVVSDNAVKVSGKRAGSNQLKDARYRLAEIQYGMFKRVMHLPSVIDTEKTTASYSDGLLEIHLPKVQGDITRTIAIDGD